VIARYAKLGQRCKVQLAAVGYSGPSVVPRSGIKAQVIRAAAQ
jgi:hypothetical protein